MKRILITGATGFVGQFLLNYLQSSAEHELYGTYHSQESLERLGEKAKHVVFHQVDLNDKDQVFNLIQNIKPHEIYHLAAQASVPESFQDPVKTFANNVNSEIYLFEAVRTLEDMHPRILIISTSEIYGLVKPEDIPVDEETPLRPMSPYAVSKIAQDFLALQYVHAYKMDILRVRPFNHIGPGQSTKFVVPAFARQIAEIEMGKQEAVMKVGNLTAKKDFTDVRDIVKAYVLLMEKGTSGEVYNIGSGKSISVQEILDMLLSYTTATISVESDPKLFRPVEIPELRCDMSKFHQLTGWEPEIALEQTLKDTLDYFRNLV